MQSDAALTAIHGVEAEDLEQELMLDCLSRKQAYDPEKAKWPTFVDRIPNHKCAALLKSLAHKNVGPASVTFHSMCGLRVRTAKITLCLTLQSKI